MLQCSNVICRLYLISSVTIVLNDRKYSKLMLVKSYVRSTIIDERLNSLEILEVEKDILDRLDISKLAE